MAKRVLVVDDAAFMRLLLLISQCLNVTAYSASRRLKNLMPLQM